MEERDRKREEGIWRSDRKKRKGRWRNEIERDGRGDGRER